MGWVSNSLEQALCASAGRGAVDRHHQGGNLEQSASQDLSDNYLHRRAC